MSTFPEEAAKPDSQPIILLELDIGQAARYWFNWRAGVWVFNFDVVFDLDPLIDPSFLNGVTGFTITQVGSVRSDGLHLAPVASAADVQPTELTFYWDSAAKNLYIHLQNSDEPSLHQITIGTPVGVADQAVTLNNMLYESRLLSAPAISKGRDALFFGKIAHEGGKYGLRNDDGEFDRLAEDVDVFGNAARQLIGFAGLEYSQYVPQFAGYIERIDVGPERLDVKVSDKRKSLSAKIPNTVFTKTAYSNLIDRNVGKAIPIGYGTLLRVPVICTNEAETPAPAQYSFKLFDTTHHGIKAIDKVYVEGVEKSPTGTDLTAATLTLAAADYSPGDEVLVDCRGYVNALGALIENALDIIKDLLTVYFPLAYTSSFFNTGEWEIARQKAPAVCYFADKPTEIIKIIEAISASVFGSFIVQDDGRYTYRIYDPLAPALQNIPREEILETPSYSYDPSEVLTSVLVGHTRYWDDDSHRYYHYTAQEAAIFERYKVKLERTYDTLLTSEAAALAFAQTIMAIAGSVACLFSIRTKLQTAARQVGDMIEAELARPDKPMLGWVKAHILGKDFSVDAAEITLHCRLVELIPETIYVQGSYYGDSYYGDTYYSATGRQEVA